MCVRCQLVNKQLKAAHWPDDFIEYCLWEMTPFPVGEPSIKQIKTILSKYAGWHYGKNGSG